MWAKSLLLSAFVAVGANAAPVEARPNPAVLQPQWVFPAQGRDREDNRQQSLRPIREVIQELRGRYGGEYVGHTVEGGPRPIYVITWRMPDGQYRVFHVNAAR
jgi:hypothetical protein